MAVSPFNVLSLCSGGGGLDLGIKLAVPSARTICYLENEVTAAGVLVAHMEDKRLDPAPLWTDVRTFEGRRWSGVVDCVIGGYPCQPFSNAGRRLGAADPRHLWPHIAEIVRAVGPQWCFFENVGAHLRLGFFEVAQDLHGMGFRVAATLLTAEEVGAPHGRERLFILARRVADTADRLVPLAGRGSEGRAGPRPAGALAQLADAEHPNRGAELDLEHPQQTEVGTRAGRADDGETLANATRFVQRESNDEASTESRAWARGNVSRYSSAVADAERERLQGLGEVGSAAGSIGRGGGAALPYWPPGPEDDGGWRQVLALRPELAPAVESPLRGMVDGVAGGLGRSDQLHILGNGVVPQQAAAALLLLMHAFT